ncbi:11182_t:CDS:2 [Paraglomus occultum]|uniref:11182_t:CDS:1 n=1 Tax=Paraglomus occultum TaxID=144539 RepID=A0A9N8WAP4_9GLOM|nr:11182_t:CDS:2 [Paraglomus occultum]
MTRKDSGDVWIIGRVEKEIYENSKNDGISDNVLGDNIIDSEDDYDTRDKAKVDPDHLRRTPFQKKLYHFFEEPQSLAARFFSVFSALCTIGTVSLVCVNSLPKYELSDRPLLLPLRILFSMIFTIEYLGRFFASVDKKKYFFGIMSILDLIAIIPFFIQIAFTRQESGLYFLRVLQLVRFIRLSDFIRHSVGFKAAMKVVRRSSNQILFMAFWYTTIIILSSSLMFLTERGVFDPENKVWLRRDSDGHLEVSPFQSILHSFYWSVVTITTTGYGDDIPYTLWGRIVTGVAITCGLLFLVIPSSIIGSNLSVEWTRAHRLAKLKETRQLAQTPKDPANITSWQIKYLQRRNRELLEAIAEVQDVLADVNPRKYREIQMEHVAALQKIVELESELERWKQIACNHERSSKRDVPANAAVGSSIDTHSIEHSVIAPESAYTYKDDYDHPQSVMTAQVTSSARLAPNTLLRSATLPCGECPKYNDKNVISAKESGLMGLFQQRLDASARKTDEASGVTSERDGGNVTADVQHEMDNFLNRRAVDDCIISEAGKNEGNISSGGDGDGDGNGEAGGIEIVVERSSGDGC